MVALINDLYNFSKVCQCLFTTTSRLFANLAPNLEGREHNTPKIAYELVTAIMKSYENISTLKSDQVFPTCSHA